MRLGRKIITIRNVFSARHPIHSLSTHQPAAAVEAVDDGTTTTTPRQLKYALQQNVKRKRGKSPFANLDRRMIPSNVLKELHQGTFLKRLRRFGRMSLSGYEHYWRCLLWASEWYEEEALKKFDMNQAKLQSHAVWSKEEDSHRHSKQDTRWWWFLQVPGLEEDRPSVMPGDAIHVTWNEQVYKGKVVEVYLEHIRISLMFSQFSTFDEQNDRVHVRFVPASRVNYILGHYGTSTAKEVVPLQVLAPILKNANSTLKKTRQRMEQERQQQAQDIEWFNPNLNQEQRQAVCQVLSGACQPLPYLLHGPPGTGKSATVTEIVLQLVKRNPSSRILVLAPSNDAADVLLNKLRHQLKPSSMVRLLSFRRIDSVPANLLPYVHVNHTSHESTKDKIMQAKVTVTTVNMATRFSSYGVQLGDFATIVMDEASHATEPETITVASTLLDFESGGQLVLAGDPKQLGPVVLNPECTRLGLDRSFMERISAYSIYKRNKKSLKYEKGLVTMLTRNYRSHEAIIRLPNDIYYDGDLTCHADSATSHNMCEWEGLPRKGFPVLFHAVDGENQREETSPSWFNPQEVETCIEHAQSLIKDAGLTCDEVGIITPYTAQVGKIRQALKEMGLSDVKVGSVETFQGQERRAIILSTVRSARSIVKEERQSNLGFVANNKRFNVALTRAQALLIVVGCPRVLSTDKHNWLPFLKYCHENGAWKGDSWNQENNDTGASDMVTSIGCT